MERIERMSGPLVLRYKSDEGETVYWNWATVHYVRVQSDAGGTNAGGMLKGAEGIMFLSVQEAQQVREQLDTLIDPPTFRVNVKKQERESDLWAGHPSIAKPDDE